MNNISKLVTALVRPIQDLDASGEQLRTQRTIDTAVGAQLDVLGRIVDQPRNGDPDDVYRRRIRARIAIHRSNGLTEDLLRVIDLVIFEDDAIYVVRSPGIATVVVRIDEIAITDALADIAVDFLIDTTSAGVRLVLESGSADPESWFRLDEPDVGLDQGHMISARDRVLGL